MTAIVKKGTQQHPELVHVVCNECGAEQETHPQTLVNRGWHFSLFELENDLLGYAQCNDCTKPEQFRDVTEALTTSSGNEQLEAITKLRNNATADDITKHIDTDTTKQQNLCGLSDRL